MATFVGSSAVSDALTTLALPWPAGTTLGDVALLAWNGDVGAAWTDPPGFVLVDSETGGGGSQDGRLYRRVCDGTETGTVDLTHDIPDKHTGILAVYRDIDPADPVDAYAVRIETTAGTTHASPQVVTTVDDAPIVTVIQERFTGASDDYTAPAGYTEREDPPPVGGGGATSAALADDLTPTRTAGAYTPPPWTDSTANDNTLTWTVALTPAAAGVHADLGRAAGTGTARSLTAGRIHHVARATGTGTARALTATQAWTLGRVTATGTARPLTSDTDQPALVQMPDVRVEVAFADGADTGGLLQLDDPTRGILDSGALGGGLTSTPVWTDITPWFRSASVERGARRIDQPVVTSEPGTLTVTLDNSDRRFTPGNLDGPYIGDSTVMSGESEQINADGGFEDGLDGWAAPFGGALTRVSAPVRTGSWAGEFTPDGSTARPFAATQWAALTAGQTYRATAWVRCSAATTVQCALHWYTSNVTYLGQTAASASVQAGIWTRVQVTGVAPATATQGPMLLAMPGTPPSSTVMHIDDVVLAHMPYRQVSQVTAMRAVRVLATWDDTLYEVWRGYADQWDADSPDHRYGECVLTATDASKVLSGVDRTAVAPVGGGEDTGARVHRILDSAGWPVPDRDIDTGDSTVAATDLGGDAWSELQTVAATEIGSLHVDGGGRVVFRARRAALTDPRAVSAQGVFGDAAGELPIEALAVVSDDDTFFNVVAATRSGGDDEQTAEDADSIALYYRKTYRPESPILETDADTLGYVQWLLHIASDPETRFTELEILPAAGPLDLWPHALDRRPGDRITVRRRDPASGGTVREQDVFIRGVRHEFDDASWRTTWTLQAADRHGPFLRLDDPDLGRLDETALAY